MFGGPAGAGKSTLARAWCARRERAAHVELDDVRELITGLADVQEYGGLQDEQYDLAVSATCALVRAFAEGGYDVAVGDVLEPATFERLWRPQLDGLDRRLVIVLPSLPETLARSRARAKRVQERHTRRQHEACAGWPPDVRIDTTGLSVAQSLRLAEARLAR